MKPLIFTLLSFASLPSPSTAANFRTFYPEYASIFTSILDTSCSTALSAWTVSLPPSPADYAANGTTTSGEALIQCVLSNTSEFIKANMASAAVLLGIMPFALSVLGSSSEESALLYVIARRPLLTTLLLAGSPVVVALRPFEYKDPVGILRAREGRFYSFSMGPSWVVVVLEYIVVLASVVNVVHVTYGLGMGVATMILPDSSYLPGVWAATGIVVHIIGALCLRSRLKLVTPKNEPLIRSEFTLSEDKNITVETVPETKMFLVLSWLTSTLTTFHVIFGTLAFSSCQFISVRDAFGVIGRYTASVTVCRVVLMYELSGLRSSVDSKTVVGVVENGQDPVDGLKAGPRVFTFAP